MGTIFGTIVALSILGGPLGLTHEAQLCALAEKCHEIEGEVPADPMRLTLGMSRFVKEHVDRDLSPKTRLTQLIWAVHHPKALGFRYAGDQTKTAGQAFNSASGDCVSFSLMFVALARHAGLDARFQMVCCKAGRRRARGFNASMRHINVLVLLPREKREIDVMQKLFSVNRRKGSKPQNTRSLVPDRCALAAFFNNCCVEKLSLGDYLLADRLSRAAVNLAPECAESWVNFGVCQRLLGQFETAEAAYLRALSHQSSCRVAKDNLDLLRRMTKAILVKRDLVEPLVDPKIGVKKGVEKSNDNLTLVVAATRISQ